MAGSDFTFNIAKGKEAYYASLPAANDALVVILLKSGHEADSALKDYDTFAAIDGGTGNTECDFTNYARKSITSVTATVDDTDNAVYIDFADQTWTAAGGASNNTISKAIVCYDPDTTGGDDTALIPISAHTFDYTTTGVDLTLQVHTDGFVEIVDG